MNAPNPPHWTLNSAFRTIWVHSGPFGCLTKLGAQGAEVVQKFVPRSRVGIFPTNAPDPPHWTLNSCSGAFHTIWVHLEPIGCLTKLSAKRVELVQNIVLRSRVRIFRNEHTRSTPLDPKLMFWCVSYRFGALWTVRLPYETRCKTGRTSAKVCATKSHWNFSQQKHPIHPIGP